MKEEKIPGGGARKKARPKWAKLGTTRFGLFGLEMSLRDWADPGKQAKLDPRATY